MKYFIRTFGCQQNLADSERIAGYYRARGFKKAKKIEDTDLVVVNTCMVRQQAEDRIYGLVKNLEPLRQKKPNLKIVVTGCLVGAAAREPSGKIMRSLRKKLSQVDEFLPLEEVGFDYPAVREDENHAWLPISNGCNNFCTYCIVPFSRGREVSRKFDEIVKEAKGLEKRGVKHITLLGQNVNSYGADLVKTKTYTLPSGRKIRPVMVKHLGRLRIPTLFPYLLEELCKISGIKKISFLSSNPWDFSDELISIIAKHPKIDRQIHLPVQAGDDEILKKMNRWYTQKDYLLLIKKIKEKVPDVSFSTDIIVGFPTETKKAFENTVRLAKEIGFEKAYIAKYSPRPQTAAEKIFKDDISPKEKTRRFHILDELINKKKN